MNRFQPDEQMNVVLDTADVEWNPLQRFDGAAEVTMELGAPFIVDETCARSRAEHDVVMEAGVGRWHVDSVRLRHPSGVRVLFVVL